MQTLAERFAQIMRAYAAGDAYGVQYEFKPKGSFDVREELLEVDGWPAGGVSDDTVLSLMTLEALVENQEDSNAAAAAFLRKLRAAKDTLRGLGPTTRAALGLEVKPEEQAFVGASNGGVMRCSMIGLALHGAKRRDFVAELTAVTHDNHRAIAAALAGSRLISDAIELGAALDIDQAVQDEVSEYAREILAFQPTEQGVTLDPIETIGAAIAAVKAAHDANSAMQHACEFGGDTDTTAALAAAIFVARRPIGNQLADISWLPKVQWQEIPQLDDLAFKLSKMRTA